MTTTATETAKKSTPNALAATKPRAGAAAKHGWKISKTIINFWLDTLLMLLFVVLCWTQVVLQYIFPVAQTTEGWTLWGMSFAEIQSFQFAIFATLALGIVVHVTMHWPWVCGVVVSRFRKRKWGGKHQVDDGVRTLWGVGSLVVILNLVGGALAAAYLMINGPN